MSFVPAVIGGADPDDDAALVVRRMLTTYYDASYPPSLFPGAGPSDPNIATLTPNTGVDGAPATVTIDGTHFDPDAQVEVDGIAQATTFVSATKLTASYTPAIGGAASVIFTVRNVGTGMESNDKTFLVTAAITEEDQAVEAEAESVEAEAEADEPPSDPPTPRRRRSTS